MTKHILPFCLLLPAGIATAADTKPTDLTRRVETLSRMDKIEGALRTYTQAYNRIPCPAQSDIVPDNASFGQEASTADDCSNATDPSSGNIFSGTVPVRTLQLPDEYMLDGWGRRFLYVVDQRFANRGLKATDLAGNESSYISTIKGEFELRDTAGGNQLYNNLGDEVAALVISAGTNGHGAYTKEGNRIDADATDADELANSHYRGGGAFDTLFIKKEPTDTFDDAVRVIRRNSDFSLFCPGYGTTTEAGGSTPDAQLGYPAYNWPGVAIGTEEVKQCTSGYEGDVRRTCTSTGEEAVWDRTPPDPASTCQCPEITGDSGDGYGNVTWPATTPSAPPGTEVTTSCGSPTPDANYDGFYSGTVSRSCVGDGTVWADAVSACTCNTQTLSGTGYNATFPAGVAIGSTSTQGCEMGYTGSVTATCQPSGGWQVTGNNCAL